MAKLLNSYQINLGFTADTSKAKRQLQDLLKQLTQIVNLPITSNTSAGITKQIREASIAAAELKVHLQNATNADTGTLDFTKLNQSIKLSGNSLNEYADKLLNIGPAGKLAFLSLALSVANAEVPIKRSNLLVTEMWTTLKNAARWQISSSVLHGFMGALSGAVGYAQDLNKSLNDIRIVTGNNIDLMAKFAEEANKAARALSTTTTDYTNASLIYYQQGLPEEQIEERTAVTIKMANAAGVSAEKVSDQMTAVWNNFYDGSKSLEYYADVMTALGAATASSTDEISEGLNKFAAVASTVGLSYEYATAALATVTAETRESADIVGTAYKTLFARIQGLQLGETLDDGTNLNKYSKALANVGIQIKDESGNMKEMDNILNELGAKWGTLAKDLQLALAQTVAGVRQYTQLVALMDNWETFQENLVTARGAEGALDELAEIYAESWEAARDRVRAAWEGIYEKLIDDEAFIDILNVIEKLIVGLDNFIDGIGGLSGVLTTLGAAATKVFSNLISLSLTNLTYNMKMMTKTGRKAILDLKKEYIQNAKDVLKGMEDSTPTVNETAALVYGQLLDRLQDLINNQEKMNDLERLTVQILMDLLELRGKQALETAKKVDEAKEERSDRAVNIYTKASRKENYDSKVVAENLNALKASAKASYELDEAFRNINKKTGATSADIQKIRKAFMDLQANGDIADGIITNDDIDKVIRLSGELEGLTGESEKFEENLLQIKATLGSINNALKDSAVEDLGIDNSDVDNYINAEKRVLQVNQLHKDSMKGLEESNKGVQESIEKSKGALAGWADALVASADIALTTISTIEILKGTLDTLSDPNLSGMEKFITLLTTGATALIQITTTARDFGTVFAGLKTKVAASSSTIVGAIGKIGAGFTTAVLPIVGVTAAVIGAVVVIKMLVDYFDESSKAMRKASKEAERARESSEKLTEASNELASALGNIKSGFDAYDTAVDKLNKCVKGTSEWNEALNDVNNSVLDLLESYPELLGEADLFTRNKDGALLISDEKKEEVLSEIEKKSLSAQAAAIYGQAQYKVASAELDKATLREEIGSVRLETTTGNIEEFDTGKWINDNLDKLIGKTPEEFEKIIRDSLSKKFKNTGLEFNSLITNLKGYLDLVEELAQSTQAASTQMSNAAFIMANQALGDKYTSTEKSLASSSYQQELKSIAATVENTLYGYALKDTKDLNLELIWNRFLAATGTKDELDTNAIRGNKKNRKIAYKDYETGEVSTYTPEHIANTIAAYEAMENLTKSAEEASDFLSELGERGTKVASFLGGGATETALSDLLSTFTQSDLNKIQNGIDEETGQYFVDVIEDVLGMTLEQFKEFAEMLGTTDTELFSSMVKSAEKVSGTISEDDKKYFNQIGVKTDNLSVELQKNFLNAKNSFAETANKIGFKESKSLFKDNNADLEKLTEFTSAINQLDLTAEDAPEQLQKLAEQYNIQGSAIGKLIQTVENLDRTYSVSTANIQQNAAAIKEVVGDGLQSGDIISEEDIKKLEAAGIDTSDYFTLMADGSYSLTGYAEDFNNIIKLITLEGLEELLEDYKKLRANISDKYYINEGDLISGVQDTSDTGLRNLVKGKAALEYLQSFEDIDFSDIKGFEILDTENLDELVLTEEHLKTINELLQLVNLSETEAQGQLLTQASTLSELYGMMSLMDTVSSEAFSASLVNLASQYDICTNEINEYNEALMSGNETTIAATQAALEHAIGVGEMAEAYDLDAEALENYAERLEEEEDGTKRSKKAALDLAVMNTRLNRGISDLYDNFEIYTKILKNSDKESAEYSETMDSMKNILADVFNVADGSMLSDTFVLGLVEDGELLKAIMNGDVEAVTALRMAVADDVVTKIIAELDSELAQTEANALWDWIQTNTPDLSVETHIEGTDLFVTKLNELIKATDMTKDEVNSLLGSMGMSAELVSDYVPQEMQVPTWTEVSEPVTVPEISYGPNEELKYTPMPGIRRYTIPGKPVTVMGYLEVVSIKTTAADGTSSGGGIDVIAPKATPNYSNTSAGRKDLGKTKKGSEKAKPSAVKKTGKSDVVERYKEINDQIDDMSDKLEDASREADRLYGKDRIKAMQKVNNILQSEIDLLEQKKDEAEDYLKIDKKALQQAAKNSGLGAFTFDKAGNITNYEEQMTKMYERLAAAQEKAQPKNFSTKEAQDAYIEKNVTPLEEQIAELETAIGQYDETRELIEDLDNEAREKFNEWQDNNFEMLNYELELDLKLNEQELERLEYMLSKMEDDFYSMAEAAALMVGELDKLKDGEWGGLMEVYFDNLDRLEELKNDLIESYRKGEISQDAFVSGMLDLESQAYDALNSIQELDKSMVAYYGDTLAKAQEELEQYTSLMEHHNEVLEHYKNIMDIIGKSTDYERMGKILEGQVELAENNLAVSKKNYEILQLQATQRQADFEDALNRGADAEAEVLKLKWLDAQNVANEAQAQMIADTEAWAEALKAVLENELAGFGAALEDALTGDFGSFDEMTSAMERANSLQEEYLTTTNQIYETDKLINQAQKDIDKTTNTVAKKRLQNYIKETEQLQNLSLLSQYELEIQLAKYDLLLAEIALEEAQNAKSTVRLQRDAEGNFGYVYTADQNKVAEAEQSLADAQNRLYNIGLEGANGYSEKYQLTLAEMYDTLTELQQQYLEGAFANEEEYNNAVAAAKEFYFDKLKQYSELYQVALTTDSRVVADAWSTDFNDMIYTTGDWEAAVDEYLDNVKTAFNEWEEQIAKIEAETVGPDLESLSDKINDITDANDELAEAIVEDGGLLDALEAEIEDVNDLTNAYAKMRKEIKDTQTAHENLIKQINKATENPDVLLEEESKEKPSTPQSAKSSDNSSSSSGSSSSDEIDANKIKKGTIVEVKSGTKWYYDSHGTSPTGMAKDGSIKYINNDGTHPYNIEGLGWIRKADIKKITKYDTGGYTGSWGSYGKLAMLHEKELILNKHDTENFLASMDVLERILQTLDLTTLSSQLGGILSTPTLGTLSGEALEQNITIEASFPGVSVASEIEEAFNNLANLASQYANRK